MAVEDLETVDLEVELNDNRVKLIILDGLPWEDNAQISYHLTVLVRKIRRYLDAAESDDFREKHPNTPLSKVSIEVVLRYSPPAGVERFLDNQALELLSEGVTLIRTIEP